MCANRIKISHVTTVLLFSVTKVQIQADLIPSINFNSSDDKSTLSEIEKLDHFKQVWNDDEFLDQFRCPRNISAVYQDLKIVIQLNSKGYAVLEPAVIKLDHFSHLIKVFLGNVVWETIARDGDKFTNVSTATLDKTCKNKDKVGKTLKSFYADHDLVLDSLAAHSLDQIADGVVNSAFELIAISKLCKLPEVINGTLERYLKNTVGMTENPCEISACTINPLRFKKNCYWYLSILASLLIVFQCYLFFGRNTKLAKFAKQHFPILQLCWPGPIGRMNLIMDTFKSRKVNRRAKRVRTGSDSDNTLPTSDISSDSEFQSFRANMAIKNIAVKKRVRSDRKLIIFFVLFLIFMTFMTVFATSAVELQDNYCKLLESLRSKIL